MHDERSGLVYGSCREPMEHDPGNEPDPSRSREGDDMSTIDRCQMRRISSSADSLHINMDKDTLLQLRRDAREEKRKLDQWRLDLHRQIVDLLFRGDAESLRVRTEALGQIEKWEQRHLCHPRYAHTWREWLDMPEEYARAAMLRKDDLGVSMRQNSPFDHAMARLANIEENDQVAGPR